MGFVGKDVATALGYAKSDKAINQYVETDDKLRYQIGTSGQKREIYSVWNFIPIDIPSISFRGMLPS